MAIFQEQIELFTKKREYYTVANNGAARFQKYLAD